jgi:light-harvesting complex 1 beta chain
MTREEAQEFHAAFMRSFIGFTVVALIAHVLAWMWRPWFPGVNGYTAADATDLVTQISSMLT